MAAYLTENDILKSLVRKGALSDLCKELNTQILSSPRPTAEATPNKQDSKDIQQRDQMRQVAKIWTALSKLIRSQCNKDRIIDSIYFGSFSKTSVVSEKGAINTYTYCPGPRSVFTLISNDQNIRSVPQEIIDNHLVSISFQAIAEVCNCTAEMVQAVLQLIRDELIDMVQHKKREVRLGFQIGTLNLGAASSVEFKSLTIQEAQELQQMSGTSSMRLTEYSLRGLEKRSGSQRGLDDKSVAERSISYMQQRQSTASVGSRTRAMKARGAKTNADKVHGSAGKVESVKARGLIDGTNQDAPYFQKRLIRSRGGRHASNGGPAGPRRTNDPFESHNQTGADHQHLNQFLKDQLGNAGAMSNRSDNKNKQHMRSTVSQQSSRRSNALIELAAQHSKPNGRKNVDAESFTANVMKMSNYQADPVAATIHNRTLGLSKINVTKNQIKQEKDLFSQSLKVKGDMRNGLKIEADAISTASSAMVQPATLTNMTDIEKALYRKKISDNYHTSVPKFLRSQGPFAVYDHAAHKGSNAFETVGSVNEMALARYHKEISDVKKVREGEKTMFYSAIDWMNRVDYQKQNDRKRQNIVNMEFIKNQIEEKARVKQHHNQVESLYYKPHFGPEETLVQVQRNLDVQKQKQEFLKMNLSHQIQAQRAVSEASRQHERKADQRYIKETTKAQRVETEAIQQKEKVIKQNLRETWERQMDIKNQHRRSDGFFN